MALPLNRCERLRGCGVDPGADRPEEGAGSEEGGAGQEQGQAGEVVKPAVNLGTAAGVHEPCQSAPNSLKSHRHRLLKPELRPLKQEGVIAPLGSGGRATRGLHVSPNASTFEDVAQVSSAYQKTVPVEAVTSKTSNIRANFENLAKEKEQEDRRKAEAERAQRMAKERQEQEEARRKLEGHTAHGTSRV
ncbi:hypothetical protein P7K49_021288 [Saguinus oedipus]|uniref:Uncharacterized protein n=1 Tax=Saguinus oedipus TaxID=9490 RepID=A0ABQ9UT12_SAGOE|nr:hypothetical protein P7K49_021288 [Saguinus oedipus]